MIKIIKPGKIRWTKHVMRIGIIDMYTEFQQENIAARVDFGNENLVVKVTRSSRRVR